MSKLYEIAPELRFVQDVLDTIELSQNGDHPEATVILREQLDQLEVAFADKAMNICKMIREHEGDATKLKYESDRLRKRAQTLESQTTWLKDYLRGCMESAGLTRLRAGIFTLAIQKNGGKPPLLIDENLLPPDARWWKMEPQVNRDSIREALEVGEPIPGARILEVGSHLRIR